MYFFFFFLQLASFFLKKSFGSWLGEVILILTIISRTERAMCWSQIYHLFLSHSFLGPPISFFSLADFHSYTPHTYVSFVCRCKADRLSKNRGDKIPVIYFSIKEPSNFLWEYREQRKRKEKEEEEEQYWASFLPQHVNLHLSSSPYRAWVNLQVNPWPRQL